MKTHERPRVERQPVGALNRRDAAAYVGCSSKYLDNEVAAGRLRRVMLGRKPVFRVCDLDKFLESRLEGANHVT